MHIAFNSIKRRANMTIIIMDKQINQDKVDEGFVIPACANCKNACKKCKVQFFMDLVKQSQLHETVAH